MAEPVYSRIVREEAKVVLEPLGFRQRGRSRIWYRDFGWHCDSIEFQASSKPGGTYLNVGMQLLWTTMMSLGPSALVWRVTWPAWEGGFGGQRIDFDLRFEHQYRLEIRRLAERAVPEVQFLTRNCRNYSQIEQLFLRPPSLSDPPHRMLGLGGYHLGLIHGLRGEMDAAEAKLSGVVSALSRSHYRNHKALVRAAHRLLATVPSRDLFVKEVSSLVRDTRTTLRLHTWTEPFPWEGAAV